MPIILIVAYCLIAFLVLVVLTFHCEMQDEQRRCDKLKKSPAADAKPGIKNLHHPA